MFDRFAVTQSKFLLTFRDKEDERILAIYDFDDARFYIRSDRFTEEDQAEVRRQLATERPEDEYWEHIVMTRTLDVLQDQLLRGCEILQWIPYSRLKTLELCTEVFADVLRGQKHAVS